ncbi:MAG: PAS domain S-box protein [Nitrosomonadales bacterium]|nr:PAS domain S-box protein [Nitrosomonadales bacterium]
MRITSQLKISSTLTIIAVIVMTPVLTWSLGEFKHAKNDYVIATTILDNFFERASLRDQYFLYREERVRVQWEQNKAISDRLLQQAIRQFRRDENQQTLERLRLNVEDTAAIFRRVANNTRALNAATENRHVYEELDRRLSSQLLLKAAAVRDTATALKDASAQQVETTYRHLTIIIGLFAFTLALATILTSMHLRRIIRKRLAPLHDGAKIVADGNLNHRIGMSGSDEFSELARSINAMTDKLAAEISARKAIEEDLRNNALRLELALHVSNFGIWNWDFRSGVVYLSPEYYAITGYRPDEVVADFEFFKSIIHPDDLPYVLKTMEEHMQGQSEQSVFDYRIIARDGTVKYLMGCGKIVERDSVGTPLRMAGSITDITERKRVEETLHKLSIAVEQSPASVIITDLEARIQYVNPSFTEATGYSAAEVIGQNPRILQSGQISGEIFHELWNSLTGGHPWHGELLNKRKNGELYWEETHIAPVKNPAGAITHYVAIKVDISERKAIEERLHNSEERLQAVLKSSEVAIAWADNAGVIEYLNPKFVSLFGYTLSDVPNIEQWYLHAYPDADYRVQIVAEWNAKIARSLPEKSSIEQMEVEVTCKDGSVCHALLMGSWFGNRLLANFSDITERKLIEDRIKELNRDFVSFLENTSDFIYFKDASSRFRFCSQALADITGHASWRDMIGKHDLEVFPPDTARLNHEEEVPIFNEGKPLRNKIDPYYDADGRLGWISTNKWPLLDHAGKVTGLFGISRIITESRQAEQALQRESEKNLALLRNSSDGIHILDTEGNVIEASDSFCAMLGYQRDEVIGMNVAQWDAQFTDAERVQVIKQQFAQPSHALFTTRHRRKDGSVFDVEVSGFPLELDGKPVLFNSSRDITKRKAAEDRLTSSEARLRAILDNVPYLIWLKDTEGRFIAVNKAFFKTTGLAKIQDVLGKTDLDLYPEQLAQKYRADDAEVLSTRRQKLTEEIFMDNDKVHDKVHWVETFKAPIMDMNDNLLGTTGFAQDITGRKNAEVQIRHLAHYDTLTDLPNRTLFSDRLQQALVAARRDKSYLALMFIDLDKFKPINDTLGHHVGDLLLKEVTKRMQDCVRESDTIARFGGDEFVVLLPVIEAEQDALLVAEKIRHSLNQPFVLVGQNLNISSSTGVAVYPEHGSNETELIGNADIAMYHAKEGGRNNVVLYRADMRDNRNNGT